jgi:hypothetical protein
MRVAQSVKPVWDSTAMTANRATASVAVDHIYGYACQVTWSGGTSPVGNIKVQASLDNSTWSDVPTVTSAVGANSGTAFFNVDGIHYRYIRVAYAFTSGTGTLSTPVCMTKGFGN